MLLLEKQEVLHQCDHNFFPVLILKVKEEIDRTDPND